MHVCFDIQWSIEDTLFCNHDPRSKQPTRQASTCCCRHWSQRRYMVTLLTKTNGESSLDMSKLQYKAYIGLSNVAIRTPVSTPESKALTMLVNARLNNTLPSLGAADDALIGSVMLECTRSRGAG
ncbi:hypothetical protein PLICRDRAFT_124119 [Plicaturopsis crispa FD-325 SS-3]|nr:hypothetical protein PLICRDRAFT_124119 [Plicaturopsis crispa FD-325 SS-3]